MKYYSLNHLSKPVSFEEATIAGQAPDKGLFFPEHIPVFEDTLFDNIEKMADAEIAFQVLRPYTQDSIPDEELNRILSETLSFPIPLVPVYDSIFSLELFHGPTLAFKDVGARFMSRCLRYFTRNKKEKVVILVATSGDTGGAVADGFYQVEGVEVVILYPKGKVSMVQEKQLTTLGGNIHALEIEGNFDDCQALVKKAFTDTELRAGFFLSSANSINVARWLPQQIYYFLLWKQWRNKRNPPVVSVPSGNFGNICAGILAWHSGLPVKHFIAACNQNNIVTRFLDGEEYIPRKAVPTISNAMDVGDPSNFIRVMELFDQEKDVLHRMMSSYSFTDEETREAMTRIHGETGYITDPHGAVGFLALEKYLRQYPGSNGVFLETAHPIKFPDAVEKAIQQKLEWPESILPLLSKEKKTTVLPPDFVLFREWLQQNL